MKRCFGGKINDKYAWEFSFLTKVRDWSDGITYLGFNCEFDKFEADHNPKFTSILVILNLKIFEFGIYSIHHVSDKHA